MRGSAHHASNETHVAIEHGVRIAVVLIDAVRRQMKNYFRRNPRETAGEARGVKRWDLETVDVGERVENSSALRRLTQQAEDVDPLSH